MVVSCEKAPTISTKRAPDWIRVVIDYILWNCRRAKTGIPYKVNSRVFLQLNPWIHHVECKVRVVA